MDAICRTLLDIDPYCPKCGHNRNTSSVSTIDYGHGMKQCQMCGEMWAEVIAAKPADKPSTRPGLDLPHEPV